MAMDVKQARIIARMLKAGGTEAEIQQATGCTVKTIKRVGRMIEAEAKKVPYETIGGRIGGMLGRTAWSILKDRP